MIANFEDCQKYFQDMSEELLPVWIEVAERRLPYYSNLYDLASVKIALSAAKIEQEKRNVA